MIIALILSLENNFADIKQGPLQLGCPELYVIGDMVLSSGKTWLIPVFHQHSR